MKKIRDALIRWKTNRITGTGVTMLRTGKYEKAMMYLERAIERDPENQMAWTGKGLTFAKQKRYRKAIEAYEKALGLNPSEKEREQLLGLLKSAREKMNA